MYQQIIELSKLVPRIASLFYTGAKNSKGLAPDFKMNFGGIGRKLKRGEHKSYKKNGYLNCDSDYGVVSIITVTLSFPNLIYLIYSLVLNIDGTAQFGWGPDRTPWNREEVWEISVATPLQVPLLSGNLPPHVARYNRKCAT